MKNLYKIMTIPYYQWQRLQELIKEKDKKNDRTRNPSN